MRPTALIIGGTKGIGRSIFEQFTFLNYKTYSLARSKSNFPNHICCNLSKFNKKLLLKLPSKIDCLVFSNRYRGNDHKQHFETSIFAINKFLKIIDSRLSYNSSIVFISSPASQKIFIEQPAFYHASKAALEALMRYYAVYYGKKGIRCNCVAPGTILKRENYKFYRQNKNLKNKIESVTPLGRMGTTEDVANLVVFLASSGSSFLTGQCFHVDGGLSVVSQLSCVTK